MNDELQDSHELTEGGNPQISSAPPTVADALPTKVTAWPKVLGIIFIVLGVLGIMQGCSGLVSPYFLGFFKRFIPEDQTQMVGFMDTLKLWMIASAVIVLIVAIVLLVTGIGLISRKAWSRKTALIWACTKIVIVVFNGLLGYAMQKAQFQAMQEMIANNPNTASGMPMSSNIIMAIGIATFVITVIWGWALPVFTLIWFSRKKIRSEVALWGESSQATVQGNISKYE